MGFDPIFLSFSLLPLLHFSFLSPIYGYDALDPNGNITIKWDLVQDTGDKYDVLVSIVNYQQYRHIETPGWKLSWTWAGKTAIWNMVGAEATEQGNCSWIKTTTLPHCCQRRPVIIDLLPGAPYNKQVANCCKGGVISSISQDPEKYLAAFQMNLGASAGSSFKMPDRFELGLQGYTCGHPFQVPPTKFPEDHGRRQTQALGTWNVTCSYSQFLSSRAPHCCVSYSTFYNSTIVPCPICSCGCQGQPGSSCIKDGEVPPVLRLNPIEEPEPALKCSDHMCPIKVHWHIKESYREYWRVKMTVTNMNYAKNYSQWNLVVLHPNLKSVTQVFSFNYKPLNQYGSINDTGIFYGIKYFNDMLIQSGKSGNVQTEMLLHKDPGIFTFGEGWAFPRKLYFNGDECVMPPPDEYPKLPSSASPPLSCMLCSFLLLLLLLLTLAL